VKDFATKTGWGEVKKRSTRGGNLQLVMIGNDSKRKMACGMWNSPSYFKILPQIFPIPPPQIVKILHQVSKVLEEKIFIRKKC